MTRDDISRRARMVIGQELICNWTKISDASEFTRDLGADSLDMVSLPRALEDEFGIILTDDEVGFCQTVGTAIDLIETKLENRACGESLRFGAQPARGLRL